MPVNLTREADKLIVLIYKEYLSRRKNGSSKFVARDFDIDDLLLIDKLSSWTSSDIEDTLSELHEKNLIEMDLGYSFYVTDKGIIYMENRFTNNLIEVTDFIAKFIP